MSSSPQIISNGQSIDVRFPTAWLSVGLVFLVAAPIQVVLIALLARTVVLSFRTSFSDVSAPMTMLFVCAILVFTMVVERLFLLSFVGARLRYDPGKSTVFVRRLFLTRAISRDRVLSVAVVKRANRIYGPLYFVGLRTNNGRIVFLSSLTSNDAARYVADQIASVMGVAVQ